MAFVAPRRVAFTIPQRYCRIVRATLITGSSLLRVIQLKSFFQSREASSWFFARKSSPAASLIRQARAIFRLLLASKGILSRTPQMEASHMSMLSDSSLPSTPVCAIRHAFNVKPRPRLSPGNVHLLDPMLTAGYPRHICFKHRRKTTGIQMPPAALLVIVDGSELAAYGARECNSFRMTDDDGQACCRKIEAHLFDKPSLFESTSFLI